ncbi:MAG: malic enzyme-like NAD(P)-binding protein [Kiritimatiellia bacterium]|jgi:malate dehydrogenase (oxaloacetate-decarboxylating)(NADP+)|nr:malic enzyme-like NAD(P)-binding protein [Kiritimatiellia bacterium]
MSITIEEILDYHIGGKVGMVCTKSLDSVRDLCIAYTPGVAEPVREIHKDISNLKRYTAKNNLVAVVSDGTAILGLGDLGASASIPVMEGKGVLFKAFGDVDGWPVPLNGCRQGGLNEGPTDPQRVIEMTAAIAPMYGGINLEDIAAPACFEIEDRLDEMLDIPVFHDDQWGTAVITLAGVMNYCRFAERDMAELRVVINGAGAAGTRIAEMLKASGVPSVVLCDSRGVVRSDRDDLNSKKREHAVDTSASTIGEAMKDAHVFVGVSVADCVTPDDVLGMASYPAIFAMSNPVPEISPALVAETMGDKPYVMATGRSDYPNQINNVLGFPFLFRGALDVGAKTINIPMKVAASEALAAVARAPITEEVRELYPTEDLVLGPDYVIPKPFDRRLFVEVSFATAKAAVESGAAEETDLDAVRSRLENRNVERFSS